MNQIHLIHWLNMLIHHKSHSWIHLLVLPWGTWPYLTIWKWEIACIICLRPAESIVDPETFILFVTFVKFMFLICLYLLPLYLYFYNFLFVLPFFTAFHQLKTVVLFKCLATCTVAYSKLCLEHFRITLYVWQSV